MQTFEVVVVSGEKHVPMAQVVTPEAAHLLARVYTAGHPEDRARVNLIDDGGRAIPVMSFVNYQGGAVSADNTWRNIPAIADVIFEEGYARRDPAGAFGQLSADDALLSKLIDRLFEEDTAPAPCEATPGHTGPLDNVCTCGLCESPLPATDDAPVLEYFSKPGDTEDSVRDVCVIHKGNRVATFRATPNDVRMLAESPGGLLPLVAPGADILSVIASNRAKAYARMQAFKAEDAARIVALEDAAQKKRQQAAQDAADAAAAVNCGCRMCQAFEDAAFDDFDSAPVPTASPDDDSDIVSVVMTTAQLVYIHGIADYYYRHLVTPGNRAILQAAVANLRKAA